MRYSKIDLGSQSIPPGVMERLSTCKGTVLPKIDRLVRLLRSTLNQWEYYVDPNCRERLLEQRKKDGSGDYQELRIVDGKFIGKE